MHYSWDEGLTWERYTFAKKADGIEVNNIIIEPSNIGLKFLIYGKLLKNPNQGAVVSLDFSSLHQRECVGSDDPLSEDSDYEFWSPSGKKSDSCILGRQ